MAIKRKFYANIDNEKVVHSLVETISGSTEGIF